MLPCDGWPSLVVVVVVCCWMVVGCCENFWCLGLTRAEYIGMEFRPKRNRLLCMFLLSLRSVHGSSASASPCPSCRENVVRSTRVFEASSSSAAACTSSIHGEPGGLYQLPKVRSIQSRLVHSRYCATAAPSGTFRVAHTCRHPLCLFVCSLRFFASRFSQPPLCLETAMDGRNADGFSGGLAVMKKDRRSKSAAAAGPLPCPVLITYGTLV